MKTHLHNVRFISLAIGIAAAVAAQPIRAQVPTDSIILEETSPTSLTVALDLSTMGITVTNTGKDQWDVIFPSTIQFNPNTRINWTEPENPSQANVVFAGVQSPGFPVVLSNEMLVFSDTIPVGSSLFNLADGATTPISIGIENPNDPTNQESLVATFNDNAATEPTSVPEPSTFGLLALALAALFLASRLRSIRLA